MISRRFLAALAVLCAFVAPAHAQKTKAQIATEIATTFPDNTIGSITPLGLRTVTSDLVNSIMPTAPVVSGNTACFSGTTGLLQDCGSAPTTVPLTLGITPINGGTTTRVLFDNAGKIGEYSITGTGNVAMSTSAALTSPTISSPTISGATITSPAISGATITTSTLNNVTLTAPASSATITIPDGVTLTGPASSGTAMTLGNAEVVTGAKTFGAAGNVGKLLVAGTTSGSTIVNATAVASGTLTLPAVTDTLIGKATTDILTNKTLDSAGTGNSLLVSGVAVSRGQYPGESSTGSATAGNVGEYIENTASGVSLTSGTVANIASITLTAGDWDIDGSVYFTTGTSTSITQTVAGLSTTTGTLDTTVGRWMAHTFAAVVPANATTMGGENVPPYRFSVSGSTTIFLVSRAAFTVSTLAGSGLIRARRVR